MELFGFKKLYITKMRILQLIDSLEAGGAERMAVSFANALSEKISMSALVATRQEGILKNELAEKVSYLFLNKKRTIDLKSIFRLRSFVQKNKISIVHAHGTSFFLAFLLKLIYPKIKIIWHEHYGGRVHQSRMDNLTLLFSSFLFSSVFVVNHQLEGWVKKNLFRTKVCYIPNFATFSKVFKNATFLEGNDKKRIVCLANLKNPKNHIVILIAFKELKLHKLGWSLHLIGKEYDDSYSIEIKNFIVEHELENSIFIYGSKNDIQHILGQATIGILASTAEGFPVTLLEYGLAKLPVVSTNVGYCSLIAKDNFSGLLFEPTNVSQIKEKLDKMISEKVLRIKLGLNLHDFVLENYSKEKVIVLLLSKYRIFSK
jgi:glycosyltransferase involved in cell wall biosynthesis